MKIDIIYRCCGKETEELIIGEPSRASRPKWFDKQMCYKSVWDMTDKDPSTFSMHVIWDGYRTDFLNYIEGMRVSDGAIYKVTNDNNLPSGLGKYGTMDSQWDLADKLTGDWIYFVEDDYLHTPDAAKVFLEGTLRFNLLSLYDHLDRYTRSDDITTGKETVALTPSCHWRTTESTTSTWACSRKLWNDIRGAARKFGPNDRSFFYDMITNNVRLWTTIPARSTHCIKGYMSPLVNWDEVAAGVSL